MKYHNNRQTSIHIINTENWQEIKTCSEHDGRSQYLLQLQNAKIHHALHHQGVAGLYFKYSRPPLKTYEIDAKRIWSYCNDEGKLPSHSLYWHYNVVIKGILQIPYNYFAHQWVQSSHKRPAENVVTVGCGRNTILWQCNSWWFWIMDKSFHYFMCTFIINLLHFNSWENFMYF